MFVSTINMTCTCTRACARVGCLYFFFFQLGFEHIFVLTTAAQRRGREFKGRFPQSRSRHRRYLSELTLPGQFGASESDGCQVLFPFGTISNSPSPYKKMGHLFRSDNHPGDPFPPIGPTWRNVRGHKLPLIYWGKKDNNEVVPQF